MFGVLSPGVGIAPLHSGRSMVRRRSLKNGAVFLYDLSAWGSLFPSSSFGDHQMVPPSMCDSFEKTEEL